MSRRKPNILLALVCLGIGAVAGRHSRPETFVEADEKKPPDTFLSGGARSEKVLQEIHVTLKQLDGRVARIEESVVKARAAGGSPQKSR